MAELPLLGDGIVEIAEADLPVLRDAGVNLVDVIVDGLVHGLDAVGHEHLPPELIRFMHAAEPLDLLDQ